MAPLAEESVDRTDGPILLEPKLNQPYVRRGGLHLAA